MTIYEHTMLGVNGALAAGLNRRYGWQIVAWAGLASMLPDADGVTLLLGWRCYVWGHRIWTHNVLVVGILAAVLSAVAYYTDFFTGIRHGLARFFIDYLPITKNLLEPKNAGQNDLKNLTPRKKRGISALTVWIAVGVLAAYGHLAMDVIYSGGRGLPVWGVPLLWPFSDARYAYPIVTWGDPGATLIFVASMFVMVRWKSHIQAIAAGSLVAVAVYVVIRGII
jgi:membrane-bound metal-dependent hydrolase YbcI (DUF457 family)